MIKLKNKNNYIYFLLITIVALAIFNFSNKKAYALEITSTQAGNWSSPSTWAGGEIPKSGDVAIINHAITVDQNTIIGNSPSECSSSDYSSCTYVLTINAPLTISADLTIKGNVLQGDTTINANIPGITIEFDASGATNPTQQNYAWVSSAWSAGNRMITLAGTNGNNIAVKSNENGGNAYFIGQISYSNSMNMHISYVTFLRIGDESHPAVQFNPSGEDIIQIFSHTIFDSCGPIYWVSTATSPNAGWNIINSTWKNSALMPLGSNSKPTNLYLSGAKDPSTNSRIVKDSVFDKQVVLSPNGAIYEGNIFYESISLGSVGTYGINWNKWNSFKNNFLRLTRGDGTVFAGDLENNYIVMDRNAPALYTGQVSSSSNEEKTGILTILNNDWATNQYETNNQHDYHIIILTGTGAGQTRNIYSNTSNQLITVLPWDIIPDTTSTFGIYDGPFNLHWLQPQESITDPINISSNIIESFTSDNNGDVFLHMDALNGEDPVEYSIKKNIILPNAANDNSGTLVTLFYYNDTQKYIIEHNTYFTGAQDAAISEGELNGNYQAPGRITSFQSNIAWANPNLTNKYFVTGGGTTNPSPYGPYKINNVSPSDITQATLDIIASGNADYNTGFGLKNGYRNKGYNINTTTTPGINDVDVDPQFTDPNRKFNKWASSLGSSGNLPEVINDGFIQLMKMNDTSGYNSNYSILNLLSYVRSGYMPQNQLLKGAAHDGSDIGAVSMSFSSNDIIAPVNPTGLSVI